MLKSNKIEPDQILIIRERFKLLCAERGMKIGAVGQLIGKSSLFFNNVFKGKQSIYPEDVERAAEVLETNPEYLLGVSDNPVREGTTEQLSSEEKELIELYRDISPEKRDIFRKLIEQMKG